MNRGFVYAKKNIIMGVIAFLCAFMMLINTGCGKKDGVGIGEQNSTDGTILQKDPFVYVPEEFTLTTQVDLWSAQIMNDALYVVKRNMDDSNPLPAFTIEKYLLSGDFSASDVTIEIPWVENTQYMGFAVDKENSVYVLAGSLADMGLADGQEDDFNTSLQSDRVLKYDENGELLKEIDIAACVQKELSENCVQRIALDANGNLLLAADRVLLVLNPNGEYTGRIEVESDWIENIKTMKDGNVYLSYYSSTEGKPVLVRVDMEELKLIPVSKALNSTGNGCVDLVSEKFFAIADYDGMKIFGTENSTCEDLFDWVDCDLNRDYIMMISAIDEETYLVFMENWENETNQIVRLKKTPADQVKEKQIIVIGTLYDDYILNQYVVDYNKQSEEYRVKIKKYIEDDWSETAYSDGISKLTNDILTKNGPDLVALNNLNVESLSKMGALLDLAPYLKKSEKLEKKDFYESILEQCTYDKKLITIPKSFAIDTVVGKTSDVGERDGWTIQDIEAMMDENPGKNLLNYASKESMLYFLVSHNLDSFIDWDKGTCSFESEEFKRLLSLVKRFPDSQELDYDSINPDAIEIADGKLLLTQCYLTRFSEVQYDAAVFGNQPITYIGYPNSEAKKGTVLELNQIYGINANSVNKDIAWDFIEYFLTLEEDKDDMLGFPTRKSVFNKLKEEAMLVEYVVDPDTGEVMTDEEGTPIIDNAGSTTGEIGPNGVEWNYTYHVPTEEEISVVEQLMANARVRLYYMDDNIINIISEEAAAYFDGQKTVEQVTEVIQSRISLYVMENKQ